MEQLGMADPLVQNRLDQFMFYLLLSGNFTETHILFWWPERNCLSSGKNNRIYRLRESDPQTLALFLTYQRILSSSPSFLTKWSWYLDCHLKSNPYRFVHFFTADLNPLTMAGKLSDCGPDGNIRIIAWIWLGMITQVSKTTLSRIFIVLDNSNAAIFPTGDRSIRPSVIVPK
jgi:hypothetical protein